MARFWSLGGSIRESSTLKGVLGRGALQRENRIFYKLKVAGKARRREGEVTSPLGRGSFLYTGIDTKGKGRINSRVPGKRGH